MDKKELFRAELTGLDEAVRQMNLHLSIVSFDEAGQQTAMTHTDAEPAEPDTAYRAQTALPASSVAVSFYAVPVENPLSDRVSDSPAFKLELAVWKGDREIDRRTVRVNRWGGTQMIGLRYE